MWLLRSLSNVYEANLSYPVKYINIPENKVLIGELPDRLQLTIKSTGIVILKNKIRPKLIPLKFDVNSFRLNTLPEDTSVFFILTSVAKEKLSEELDKINITDISPDTLFFNFTYMVSKMVKIYPNIVTKDRILEKQHMLNGEMVILPDSILASGPQFIIDTLKGVYTEELELNNLSDSLRQECKLKKMSLLSFPVKEVEILIPVDLFTEGSLTIPVSTINAPDSIVIKPIPNSVKITYIATLSKYDRVTEEILRPHIDYSDFELGLLSKQKVLLDSIPPYIQIKNIYPPRVEVLLEKND